MSDPELPLPVLLSVGRYADTDEKSQFLPFLKERILGVLSLLRAQTMVTISQLRHL